MILSMADVLAMRQNGKGHLLGEEHLVRVVQVAPNPFRQFCRSKGITGKGKKKFRKAQRALASARVALVEQQTSGGIIHASPNR